MKITVENLTNDDSTVTILEAATSVHESDRAYVDAAPEYKVPEEVYGQRSHLDTAHKAQAHGIESVCMLTQ